MINSLFFLFLQFGSKIIYFVVKFNDIYIDLTALPWNTISNISIFLLMNEYTKYIIVFDLLTFLGFSKKFASFFNKFTKLITFVIQFICMMQLVVVYLKAFLEIKILNNELYI